MDIIQEAKAMVDSLEKVIPKLPEDAKIQAVIYKNLISRLVDRLEWKSIESAPKQTYDADGELIEILLMEECGNRYLGYWNDDTNSWIDSGGVSILDIYTDYEMDEKHEMAKIEDAKYWLPLPPVGDKQK